MNRRRLMIAAASIGGALLTLAYLQGGADNAFMSILFDAILLGVALALLSRIKPAKTEVGESGRLVLGSILSATAVIGSIVATVAAAEGSPLGGLDDWRLPVRIILSFTLGLASLSVLRLVGTTLLQKRRTLIIYGVLALALMLGDAPDPMISLISLLFVMFVLPWTWLERLSHRRGWILFLLFLFAPIGFFLHTGGLSIDPTTESVSAGMTLSSGNAQVIASPLLNLLDRTLSFVWFILPLRVILALFQGMFGIRIPIWLKFSTTYVFSTIIPGTLLLLLGMVAVYIGIGTMRGAHVRELVQGDLLELVEYLEQGDLRQNTFPADLAWATYHRVTPGMPDSKQYFPAPNPLKGGMEGLEPVPTPGGGDAFLPDSWRMFARIDSLLGERNEMEIWVADDHGGGWNLPDTLAPFPGWRFAVTEAHGILPLDTANVVFAAARVDDRDMNRIHVAMRPFTVTTLERYKQVIRADITVHPLDIVQVNSNDFEYSFDNEGGLEDYNITLSTTRDSGGSFWNSPILHGVTELQNWAGLTGTSTTYIGRVQVYTSIRGLWSTLYAWEGLNKLTIAIIIVLAGLFSLALVFSTLLAGGITRTIMRSLKELRQGTDRLRQGDLDVQLHPRSNDELGDLAVSFNHMTSDLRRMISEVTVKERLEREVQIARRIQVHLLPTELPQRANLQVGARSDPAFEVGGDYYDCIDLGERGLLIALGDVSGKGVGAAVLMSNLQASLSLLATQDIPLEDMVRLLNAQVYKNSTPEMFITFFAGLFNPEQNKLTYVNAGHDVPFLLRYGKPIDLEAGGMLLGILDDATYTPGEIKLNPGDMFTVYSDGLTEAMDEGDEEFGRDRLIQVLNDNKHLDASRLVNKVLEAIRDYAGHERAGRDDLTLLTVRVLED